MPCMPPKAKPVTPAAVANHSICANALRKHATSVSTARTTRLTVLGTSCVLSILSGRNLWYSGSCLGKDVELLHVHKVGTTGNAAAEENVSGQKHSVHSVHSVQRLV